MRKLPFTLLLAASAVACGVNSDSSTDDPSTVTSDLAKANGGETTADEAPEFGQEAAYDELDLEADTPITDTMAADPSVTAISSSATLDAHQVMIVWGKLPADPGATDSRDWTGNIAVNRGALLVARTVGFESTDHLLPRTNAQTVPFVSITRPYIDGLVLNVLEPDNVYATPVTLTYTSAATSSAAVPVQYTFDLAALEQGPVKIDAGNGYVMVGVELGHHACNQGFMRGRWHAIAPNLGVFRGIVTDEIGLPVGHVRGIYGVGPSSTAATPSNLLFGKFIDHQGKFIGLISGTYGNGEFNAKWIDKQGDHGLIHGKYFESTAVTGGGFFARYAESTCTEDTAAGP